jgi:hypothetical protein
LSDIGIGVSIAISLAGEKAATALFVADPRDALHHPAGFENQISWPA